MIFEQLDHTNILMPIYSAIEQIAQIEDDKERDRLIEKVKTRLDEIGRNDI